MGLLRTTHPTTTVLATSDVKTHLNIDIGDDDAYLGELVKSAESYCEDNTGRQFLTATYTLTMDEFPTWELVLPRPPLQSISSITYVASSDGSTLTLGSSAYKVATNGIKGRVTPSYNEVWPTARNEIDAVTVTYIAGATSSSLVPREAHEAMKLLTAHYYTNRTAVVATGAVPQVNKLGVDSLLAHIKVGEYL